MKARKLRTPQEVRADWLRRGLTLSAWAKAHGYTKISVSNVLSGRNGGSRGLGHEIAVKLGIKDGVIVEGEGHEHA
ncbi:MAG TPA: DNA-binding protein [Rhodocyclaceae bacterium]|nr:DNA-binding protein [Rhodocyclaceae bacterium]